jgi:hypothetical protein
MLEFRQLRQGVGDDEVVVIAHHTGDMYDDRVPLRSVANTEEKKVVEELRGR